MKIFDLVIKNLKRMIRDKHNLIFTLIFPVLLMFTYSVVLGGSVDLESNDVGIVNLDEGPYSGELLAMIEEINSQEENTAIHFKMMKNESEGIEKIKNEVISSLIIIPSNYSETMQTDDLDNEVIIKGQPSSSEYITSLITMNMILNEYSKQLHENVSNDTIKDINLISQPLEGMDSFNLFDFMAPGIIVFSLLMNITSITSNISEETEKGMLKRLKLSKMTSMDYVLATIVSWLIIGALEIIIVLSVSILLGYHWQGGLISICVAVLGGVLTLISSISVSIIIVSLTSSTSQAVSLSTLIALPLSFICGSFFPLPEYYVATINGYPMQIYEFLPLNQAIVLFRQLLTFGKDVSEVWINILIIAIMGIALLSISVVFFKKKVDPAI